jgi:hypothetical protein
VENAKLFTSRSASFVLEWSLLLPVVFLKLLNFFMLSIGAGDFHNRRRAASGERDKVPGMRNWCSVRCRKWAKLGRTRPQQMSFGLSSATNDYLASGINSVNLED